jgi:hypothetical protein
MHQHLVAFQLPEYIVTIRPSLTHWAELIASGRADKLNEKELLPDFLTDFFVDLLGYTRPADGGQRYTLSREISRPASNCRPAGSRTRVLPTNGSRTWPSTGGRWNV